jgi:hypothetical protein
VEAQEVVHGGVEFGDGGMVVEGGVCSMPVVVVKEGEEVGGADAGVLVGASVSPFPQAGWDEAFKVSSIFRNRKETYAIQQQQVRASV